MKIKIVFILSLISFASFAEVTGDNTKIGLLPFAEVNFSSAKVGERSGAVGGVTVGAEYTVFKSDAFSSNSKVSFKSFSKDDSNFIYSNKISTVAFVVGQTFNYDTTLAGYVVQPFTQVEAGYARSEVKTSFNFLGFSQENVASDGGFIAEGSIGLRACLASSFVPYIVGGYRYYELKEMKTIAASSKVDFSSAYGAFGLGYQF